MFLITFLTNLWRRLRPLKSAPQPSYPVPGWRRTPIATFKVKGQPTLAPPTEDDKARIRRLLDERYGKEK